MFPDCKQFFLEGGGDKKVRGFQNKCLYPNARIIGKMNLWTQIRNSRRNWKGFNIIDIFINEMRFDDILFSPEDRCSKLRTSSFNIHWMCFLWNLFCPQCSRCDNSHVSLSECLILDEIFLLSVRIPFVKIHIHLSPYYVFIFNTSSGFFSWENWG